MTRDTFIHPITYKLYILHFIRKKKSIYIKQNFTGKAANLLLEESIENKKHRDLMVSEGIIMKYIEKML